MTRSEERAAPISSSPLDSIAGAIDDRQAAWLRHATGAREAILRILQNRFREDLEFAAQLVGHTKPVAVQYQEQYANELMKAYLAESEQLLERMGNLGQAGPLTAPAHRGFDRDDRPDGEIPSRFPQATGC
jgi:hypothetical protein